MSTYTIESHRTGSTPPTGTWPLKRTDTVVYTDSEDPEERYQAIVTSGLHHLKGNDSPYWTTTATVFRGRTEYSAGCCHDLIVALVPDLAAVAAIHLSREDGTPMYAVENGLYFLGLTRYPDARNLPAFSRLWRVSEEGARSIGEAVTAADSAIVTLRHSHTVALQSLADQQVAQWAEEAETARAVCAALAVPSPSR